MSDVQLDGTNAMRQAGMTADEYLSKACKILKDGHDAWTLRDAIELSLVMAQDFHTAMMCMKMQDIRDAIYSLKEELL